ncbi:MAG: lipid-A-disaccharide synthase, partial [Candidatus Marinimicrobia bacterium]|nr:lipid-A-disaccharide synthase [Candidatus Neomarinimicrobiota bacterium]
MDPAPPNLLWVAGEISGDHHAGAVAAEVRRGAPHLTRWGLGGPTLRAAGVETLHDVDELAVMGLGEVLRRYGFFRRVMRALVAEARRRRPVAAVLVDYPGFNLRLARELKQLDIPVIYYVCPQVWAWHRERMHTMAQSIKHLLVIFPFEVELFQGTGLPVTYVGHPLVAPARAARAAPPVALPWGAHPRIALLPGSRRQELERLLPGMLAAAQRLEQTHGGSYLVAAPNAPLSAYADPLLAATPHKPAAIDIVTGQTRPLLRQARAAWVTSGTATLEAALLR